MRAGKRCDLRRLVYPPQHYEMNFLFDVMQRQGVSFPPKVELR